VLRITFSILLIFDIFNANFPCKDSVGRWSFCDKGRFSTDKGQDEVVKQHALAVGESLKDKTGSFIKSGQ
jgi:hypothetical protein